MQAYNLQLEPHIVYIMIDDSVEFFDMWVKFKKIKRLIEKKNFNNDVAMQRVKVSI